MTRRITGKIAPLPKSDDANNASGSGSGRKGLKRISRRVLDGSSALNRPSLRRLARRAGVKRINSGIYEEAPTALRSWLKRTIIDAVTYAEYGRRMTITINDILLSLKKNGVTLYGYSLTEKKRRLTRPLQRHNLSAASERLAARTALRTPTGVPTLAADASRVEFTTDRATRTTQAQQIRARVQEKAPAEKPSSPAEVLPERAQDIQLALAAYRDTVVARKSRSDAPINTVLQWINGHMAGRNKHVCENGELDVVLEALQEQDAIMVTEDEASRQRTLWFVA